MRTRLARLRYTFATLGVLAAVWSALLVWTHGVIITLGPLRITSHNARNPLLASLILFALAVACTPPGARRHALRTDILTLAAWIYGAAVEAARWLGPAASRLSREPASHAAALTLVALTLALSWTRGTFVVGGADSYGYVSEARLFVTGRMTEPQPLLRRFPAIPENAWVPLGYVAAPDRNELVPMYAPGLPLTMALAEMVGGARAVYVVMPMLAALAVWATYRLGMALATPAVGLGAALLTLASPAFIFQLVFPPMSDIPATAWWTVTLAIVVGQQHSTWRGVVIAVAAAAAILTRPNLVPLAAVIGAFLAWQVLVAGAGRRPPLLRLAWFVGGVVPASLAVAWFNTRWYGSPLRSGYSGLDLFQLSHWRTNVVQFPQWLAESQTPLLLLGFVTPLLLMMTQTSGDRRQVARAWLLAAFAGVVFLSYAFYQPYGVWWFLRFLLPAFPALAVLTCTGLAQVAGRYGTIARVAAAGLVTGATAYGLAFSRPIDSTGDYRYQIVGEYVRDRLPPDALIVAMQHSGSIKFYSGHETLRYDWLPEPDRALAEVQQARYHPYLVVDEWELEGVRKQWAGQRVGTRLDGPPLAMLSLGGVTVWELAGDAPGARAATRTPDVIRVPEVIRRRLREP